MQDSLASSSGSPAVSGDGAAEVEGAGAPPWALARRDAVEWLREQPARSIDLLITDPPYESLERHRAIGTTIVGISV